MYVSVGDARKLSGVWLQECQWCYEKRISLLYFPHFMPLHHLQDFRDLRTFSPAGVSFSPPILDQLESFPATRCDLGVQKFKSEVFHLVETILENVKHLWMAQDKK